MSNDYMHSIKKDKHHMKRNLRSRTLNQLKLNSKSLASKFCSDFISDELSNYPLSTINVYSQQNVDFIIFPTNELNNYWYNNNLDEQLLYEATDNLKLANLVLNSEEFTNIILEYKKYCLIASFLSNNKLDKNKNDILKIFNMSDIDYENNIKYSGDDLYWKLIPKYISIISKIGNIGIYKFYNYCEENNCQSILPAMKEYCTIVKKFKNSFNNKLVGELFTTRVKQIKSFKNTLYYFEKNNLNLSKNVISNLLN